MQKRASAYHYVLQIPLLGKFKKHRFAGKCFEIDAESQRFHEIIRPKIFGFLYSRLPVGGFDDSFCVIAWIVRAERPSWAPYGKNL
jgi:hypothetical protein